MALTRRFLAALGIEAEKIDEIIAAHTESTEALKAQIAEGKAETGKLAEVQAQLDKATKDLETANAALSTAEKDNYKGKYEALTAELETLKTETAAKETATAKKAALTEQLKSAGYSDRATRLILRNGFADSVELDGDGKATNLDDVIKTIQSDADFSGFTPKVKETEHEPQNPPANSGGKKAITWEDIDKITDTEQRQAVIAQNMESLGIK